MNQQLPNDLDRLRKLSGSLNEQTIREKFNTYRFAANKEHVIDLLARVTRVSMETVAIAEAMKGARQ
ncbi:MAG: hypothetical protein RIA09_04000 [Hoeflea sp.]|jgi:predicted helicase|uniref:hypothetical protein n=1 Tax=Hoeflea sp. TaxID=1940281 RepID=UPI0032F07396